MENVSSTTYQVVFHYDYDDGYLYHFDGLRGEADELSNRIVEEKILLSYRIDYGCCCRMVEH